jgi:hypothetical protein
MKLDDDARRLMDDNNFNDWWRDNPMPYYEAIKKYQEHDGGLTKWLVND